MKTLLVLTQQPELIVAVRAALGAGDIRVVDRSNWEGAEPLLIHGLAHGCLVDADMAGVQAIWIIEKIRRALPRLPIMVFSSATPWELEEEAYLKGAAQVFSKPIRPRMLGAVVPQIMRESSAAPVTPPVASPAAAEFPRRSGVENFRPTANATPALEILRNYSSILTHSLDAEGMLKQFLLFLRETLGVNRAAIFMRQPETVLGLGAVSAESRRLRSACAIGLASGLLEHFELSFDAGIGAQVFRLGRILRKHSDETRADVEAQKEFELLGVQVAVPILDRETVIGLAVLDGRVTGEPLQNNELELIFHLLEHVGLGIRNIWLHEQMAANNDLMANVLRELTNACVVVGRDLSVIHANKSAKKIFHAKSGDLEFTDLPQAFATKVYQVLKTGSAIDPFRYEPADSERAEVYRVSIAPFQGQGAGLPNAALLVIEDLTQSEMLKKLELEAASLRLVKDMAERIAHGVGNALVPLSTHQQLLAERYKDAEFRASLEVAMGESVKRIDRLCNQMRSLALDAAPKREAFPLAQLIQEAFQEAQKDQPVKSARLKSEDVGKTLNIAGDRPAFKQALREIFLNAFQANPTDPQITVRVQAPADASTGQTQQELIIEVRDNGPGFTPEIAQKATSPFFTTRTVAIGLGLTVADRIIETHHGRLEIVPGKDAAGGCIRISLPPSAWTQAGSASKSPAK